MAYSCRVEADSLSSDGIRLTSLVVTFPAIVQAQVLTHRAFSRNSSSMRAIPVEKLIKQVQEDPYIPEVWGKNQKGMQPAPEIETPIAARNSWTWALDHSLQAAQDLAHCSVHKELVNRLLHPFSWVTMIITATDWDNFFELRCHPAAQYEIRKLAEMMRESLRASFPRRKEIGQWHLPFIPQEEEPAYDTWTLRRFSTARSGRVSYNNHYGKRDLADDLRLAKDLLDNKPAHSSPSEHHATPDPEYPYKSYLKEDLLKQNNGHWEPWIDQVLYNANLKGWISGRHYQ